MIRQILIFTALLIATGMTERLQVAVLSETSFQQCNSTSCDCAARDSNRDFTTCNQACANAKCKTLSCSSGTCLQECHNCHMECTSDVGYCKQRCLSGTCSLKCNARRCVQLCDDGKCASTSSGYEKRILPRHYLVLLAILFATVAILSCLLLVLFCCKGDCCRRSDTYFKLKNFSSSLESVDSLPTFV